MARSSRCTPKHSLLPTDHINIVSHLQSGCQKDPPMAFFSALKRTPLPMRWLHLPHHTLNGISKRITRMPWSSFLARSRSGCCPWNCAQGETRVSNPNAGRRQTNPYSRCRNAAAASGRQCESSSTVNHLARTI